MSGMSATARFFEGLSDTLSINVVCNWFENMVATCSCYVSDKLSIAKLWLFFYLVEVYSLILLEKVVKESGLTNLHSPQ